MSQSFRFLPASMTRFFVAFFPRYSSGRQLMNYSYDPFDLVNTYGAFGTVGRERPEIVFEGTDDALITGDSKWKEYEFKAKPGDPNRRPPFVAPYQPRIDWQT